MDADTANAMATSIATGALKPKVAVAVSGILIFVGAFLSLSVAATIANATAGTFAVYRLTTTISDRHRDTGFRWGQIGTVSLVSPAHGTNDAQKTMGVITLALIANKSQGYSMSRRTPVNHNNVNDEWTGSVTPGRQTVNA